MIVLIGENHDDVLYFENTLRNKRNLKPLFGKFPQCTGSIFNQDVLLVHGCVTSYITGIVATTLIDKYKPLCVLLFGRCKAVSDGLKNGDVAISSRIIPIDIDQCEYYNVKVGEIPGIDPHFNIDITLLDMLVKAFEDTDINSHRICSFLSSNRCYTELEQMSEQGQNTLFLGVNDNFILDSDCISPYLACKLTNTPFISVKIIDSKIGEKSEIEHFVETLNSYGIVGKGITSFIGEIGRRDLIS